MRRDRLKILVQTFMRQIHGVGEFQSVFIEVETLALVLPPED